MKETKGLFEKGKDDEINTSSNIINEFESNINDVNDNKLRISEYNAMKTPDNIFGDNLKINDTYRKSVFNQGNQKRVSIASGLDYDGSSFIDNFPPDRYSILYSKRPSVMVNVPILPHGDNSYR